MASSMSHPTHHTLRRWGGAPAGRIDHHPWASHLGAWSMNDCLLQTKNTQKLTTPRKDVRAWAWPSAGDAKEACPCTLVEPGRGDKYLQRVEMGQTDNKITVHQPSRQNSNHRLREKVPWMTLPENPVRPSQLPPVTQAHLTHSSHPPRHPHPTYSIQRTHAPTRPTSWTHLASCLQPKGSSYTFGVALQYPHHDVAISQASEPYNLRLPGWQSSKAI